MTSREEPDRDDLAIQRLVSLHQQWCDETKEVQEDTPKQTPLDLARDVIRNSTFFSSVDKVFSTLLTCLHLHNNVEESNNNAIKLKCIQWYVTLLLELWGRAGKDDDSSTWMDTCAALLQETTTKGSTEKSRKTKNHGGRSKRTKKSSTKSGKSILLRHLVDTLSGATFLLPFGTPLASFLSTIIQKQHHETLPDVVSHLYEAFEIPNPFLHKENDGEETYCFGFLSIAAGSAAPLLENAKEEKAIEAVQQPTVAKKRRHGKNPVQQKQQKKQRVLSSLKQNRFKTTTNRTTHFHSKLKDISKLLDKKDEVESNTVRQKKRPKSELSSSSVESSKKSKRIPVITPHQSMPSGKGVSNSDRHTAKKPIPITQWAKQKAATSVEKKVASHKSANDQAPMMSPPPPRRNVTVASTPPSDTARQSLEMPQNLDPIIGETPTKMQPPRTQDCVVGETPTLQRSRSVVLENSAGVLLDTANDFDRILPPGINTKPAAVQPVKLFGAIRPNKGKLLGAKIAPLVTTKKKKNSGEKSIQMARALLRRKSI